MTGECIGMRNKCQGNERECMGLGAKHQTKAGERMEIPGECMGVGAKYQGMQGNGRGMYVWLVPGECMVIQGTGC